MGIKSYNPYTPSRRHMTGLDFDVITKSTPEKSLVVSLKKNAGRNNQGKITVRHRGGGSRRKYRLIDFFQHRPIKTFPSSSRTMIEKIIINVIVYIERIIIFNLNCFNNWNIYFLF